MCGWLSQRNIEARRESRAPGKNMENVTGREHKADELGETDVDFSFPEDYEHGAMMMPIQARTDGTKT